MSIVLFFHFFSIFKNIPILIEVPTFVQGFQLSKVTSPTAINFFARVSNTVPNYKWVRVPVPSVFNFDYLSWYIGLYHDKALFDYLWFGFPLGLDPDIPIRKNALNNHQSAEDWSGQVQEFIDTELARGALLGPFDSPPHSNFTWAPLMTLTQRTGVSGHLGFIVW